MNPRQALPVELLSTVFDSLPIHELVAASHVSTFWRAVARRHRGFWRCVSLTALSTSALDFFLARLDAGSDRSALVDISLSKTSQENQTEHLRCRVFPAITGNLHRIDNLSIKIGVPFHVDLFQALQHPAPRLDTLDITLCHETQSSDALPATLFACHAPNLRHVRIFNVQLFADRLPSAFSGITDLRYCFNQSQSFPTSLFRHCKRLKSLIIDGNRCTLSGGDGRAIYGSQLKSVELSLVTGSSDVIRHIPCAAAANITVGHIDKLAAPLLLAHLRGRIALRLAHSDCRIDFEYTARDTGMQRAFVCGFGQLDLACLPPAFVAHDLTARIEAVACTSRCAPLLAAYRELRSCARLAVSVAADEPLRPTRRALALPALECVEISSAVPLRMRTSDIRAFLESAVRPGSRAVQLALVGVELDGGPSELGERFVISQAGGPEKAVRDEATVLR